MTSYLKLLPSVSFEMVEGFENLDNILPDWANKDLEKVLPTPWTVTLNMRKKNKFLLFFGCVSVKVEKFEIKRLFFRIF